MDRKKFYSLALMVSTSFSYQCFANEKAPGFSWTLPKTVLDLTITYSYADCRMVKNKSSLSLNVVPTLTPRGIPDPIPGWRQEETQGLGDELSDVDLTVSTFPTTHILSSVTSHPVGEAASIAGNVLTGVAGIAKVLGAVSFPGTAFDKNPNETPACDDDPGAQLKKLKARVQQAQTALNNATSDDTKKKATTDLQSAQAEFDQEKARLSFTIKTTIDPGHGDSKKIPLGSDQAPVLLPEIVSAEDIATLAKDSSDRTVADRRRAAAGIAPTGLIGVVEIKKEFFPEATWVDAKTDFKALGVYVYLDFSNATMLAKIKPATPVDSKDVAQKNFHFETYVGNHDKAITYRDPAIVPVEIWLGEPSAKDKISSDQITPAPDSAGIKPKLLLNAGVPFAQYGEVEVFPLDSSAFGDSSWSITFNELGEETKVSFAGKSFLKNLTSALSQAATTAGTVATDFKPPSSNEAAALQTKADAIYQSHRLTVCMQDPSTCPSK